MTATGTAAQVTTFATYTALSAWSMADDFLLVIILFALLFVFAWYVGRGPFVALLLSFYSAYATYSIFPYMSLLPTEPAMTASLAHAGVYLAFVFIFFLIMRRVIVSDFLYINTFGLIVLSLLGVGFLIALGSHTFALTSVYSLTPSLAEFLTPAKYFFWWFSAPAVGLLIFAR